MQSHHTDESKSPIPRDFESPISYGVMQDPVIELTGKSCEREELILWINAAGGTADFNGKRISLNDLITNNALRRCISEYAHYTEGNLAKHYRHEATTLLTELTEYLSELNEEIIREQKTCYTSSPYLLKPINWPFAAICPLSLEFITHPVITPAGLTYQAKAMIEWLKKYNVEPYSGDPLDVKNLRPNLNLVDTAKIWKKELENDVELEEKRTAIKEKLLHIRSAVSQLRKIKNSKKQKKYWLKATMVVGGLSYLTALIVKIAQEIQSENSESPIQEKEVSVSWVGHGVLKPLLSMSYSLVLMGVHTVTDGFKIQLRSSHQICERLRYTHECEKLLDILIENENVRLLKKLWLSLPSEVINDYTGTAIRHKKTKIIYLLHKADPNFLAAHPDFLHDAISAGDLEAVRFLLERKIISVNQRTRWEPRRTPIEHAIHNAASRLAGLYAGNLPMIKLLFMHGADPHLAIDYAITQNYHLNIVNYPKLLHYIFERYPAQINHFAKKPSLLIKLINDHQREVLEMLIRKGLNPRLFDDGTKTWHELLGRAIETAVWARTPGRSARLEIVKLLLPAADIKHVIHLPAFEQIWDHQDEDILNLFIEAGLSIKVGHDTFANNPQFFGTLLNWPKLARIFLRDVNLDKVNFLEEEIGNFISSPKDFFGIRVIADFVNAGGVLSKKCNFSEEFLRNVVIEINKLEKIPDPLNQIDRREKGLNSIFNTAVRRGYFSLVKQLATSSPIKLGSLKEAIALANENKQTRIYNFLRHQQVTMSAQVAIQTTKQRGGLTIFKPKPPEEWVHENPFQLLSKV